MPGKTHLADVSPSYVGRSKTFWSFTLHRCTVGNFWKQLQDGLAKARLDRQTARQEIGGSSLNNQRLALYS
jgi:hypothetical protein